MTSKTEQKFEFTDFKVKAIVPPAAGQVMYYDKNVPAFGLRVSAGGAKTWIVQRRVDSIDLQSLQPRRELRRIKIGRYPAVTLANAREEARRTLAVLEQPALRKARKSPNVLRRAARRGIAVQRA